MSDSAVEQIQVMEQLKQQESEEVNTFNMEIERDTLKQEHNIDQLPSQLNQADDNGQNLNDEMNHSNNTKVENNNNEGDNNKKNQETVKQDESQCDKNEFISSTMQNQSTSQSDGEVNQYNHVEQQVHVENDLIEKKSDVSNSNQYNPIQKQEAQEQQQVNGNEHNLNTNETENFVLEQVPLLEQTQETDDNNNNNTLKEIQEDQEIIQEIEKQKQQYQEITSMLHGRKEENFEGQQQENGLIDSNDQYHDKSDQNMNLKSNGNLYQIKQEDFNNQQTEINHTKLNNENIQSLNHDINHEDIHNSQPAVATKTINNLKLEDGYHESMQCENKESSQIKQNLENNDNGNDEYNLDKIVLEQDNFNNVNQSNGNQNYNYENNNNINENNNYLNLKHEEMNYDHHHCELEKPQKLENLDQIDCQQDQPDCLQDQADGKLDQADNQQDQADEEEDKDDEKDDDQDDDAAGATKGEKKKKKKKERSVGKDYRFSKLANCHMCKRKNKYVYGCYKNWVPTSCNKFFCIDCLMNGLKENIVLIIQKEETWKCPYKKNTCQCRHCLNKKVDFQIPLIEDENEIPKLFGEAPSKKQKKNKEDIYQTRLNMKNKIRKLIDFNGQLIQKTNKLQHQLTKEEIQFYNKLIHDNLIVLDNLANKLADKDKIKEEENQGKFHYY